jgi:hypothetical protein
MRHATGFKATQELAIITQFTRVLILETELLCEDCSRALSSLAV